MRFAAGKLSLGSSHQFLSGEGNRKAFFQQETMIH